MKAIRIIAASDEYDTSLGFIIKGASVYDGAMADRGEGILIAHDIVEHQNGPKAIGPIWDELQALGGIWHARGRWGDLMTSYGSNYSVAENVASDITRMARDLSYSSWHDQMGKDIVTRPHIYDDDFREIIEFARQAIPGELDDDQPLDVDRYLSQALHHMRRGYRKCERRFGDRFGSNNQFRAIRDAVAKASKFIDYAGQEFILRWGNGDCSIAEARYID